MKVACILDTFSYECFKYECPLEQLRLDSWKEQMERIQPDFLFVESAWKGVDNTWIHELTNVKGGPGREIKDLIFYCKERRIKTVFWNKEDDMNYQYFIDTAKLFDYIFTTDKNCIERYIQDAGHENVYPLPFAAQPAIHNPINTSNNKKENVAFAGSWYAKKHLERQKDMLTILRPAKKFGLNIFDRMHTFSSNKNYKFPEEFQSYINGELSYQEMVKAYKKYKIFLNVNSVKNSPTMFSRRVFEILACGTNVISTYSKGIKKMFKDIVPITFSEEDTERYLSVLLNNQSHSKRLSLLGLREVYSKHLYKHRFNYILEKIGLKQTVPEVNGVSVIAYCRNSHLMKRIIQKYESQTWPNKELIIIVNRNDMDVKGLRTKAETGMNISFYNLPEGKSQEECLKFAIDKAKHDFVSLFGEYHYYAPCFLTDLMHSFEYTDSEIAGKLSCFCYLKSLKALVLRFPDQEHRYVPFLSGSAMIMKKRVLDQVRFQGSASGFDTKFVRDCLEKGMKLYSCDKYNHVRIIRRKEDEDAFLQKSRIIAYTEDYKTHVTV